jgi:hypothetical protein
MLMKTILLLSVVASFIDCNDFTAKRTKVEDFNGVLTKITPATLAELAPKAPEDIQKRLMPLLNDAKFVKAIIEQEGPEVQIRQRYEAAQIMIDEYGFKKLVNQGGNFVFEFDKDYIMKISAHGNRRELQTAAHNFPYGTSYKMPSEVVERFPINAHGQPLKTYQTASRIAHGLLFNQFLKECPACDGVKAVQEYLVTLPGKSNQVDDKSCVVLSKNETDIKPLTKAALNDVPVERAVCLWAGMRYAGLWNMSEDNTQINSKNELVVVDLEQPNTTQPHELFNNNRVRWNFNVTDEGERTLLNLLGHDSPHAKAIQEAKKQNILESKEKFNEFIQQLKYNSNSNG